MSHSEPVVGLPEDQSLLRRSLRWRYGIGLSLLLVTSACFMSIPWILRSAIASLERGEPAGCLRAAGLVALVCLLGSVVRAGSRICILGGGRLVERDHRRQLFAKLLRLQPSFYGRNRVGDLMSRATNDLMLVRAVAGPGILYAANAAFLYAIALVGMVGLDPVLAVAIFAPLPLLTLAIYLIANRIKATTRLAQDTLGGLSSGVQETLAGIGVVHAFGLEQRESELFRARSREYLELNVTEARWRGLVAPLVSVGVGASTLLVLILGARAVAEGRLQISDVAAFIATLGMLVMPTITSGWVISLHQRGRAARQRILEVQDEAPTICDRPDVRNDITSVTGPVEVRGLCVRYLGSERRRPALEKVSFMVRPGAAVGVAGPTASGKTTLLRALCRLVEVPDSQILVNGLDIHSLPLALWRGSVSYVPQDGFLFSASLADNVRFGHPDASDEEVDQAVRAASLDTDLDALPHGLETLVGPRGVRLSGGQRQRVALARALVRPHRMLLLDDCLSNVDTSTAARILERLRERADATGSTLVLAAHRTATLAFCDEVVVLERGRCVERGAPAELLERRGGVYATLAAREREDAAFARLKEQSESGDDLVPGRLSSQGPGVHDSVKMEGKA